MPNINVGDNPAFGCSSPRNSPRQKQLKCRCSISACDELPLVAAVAAEADLVVLVELTIISPYLSLPSPKTSAAQLPEFGYAW